MTAADSFSGTERSAIQLAVERGIDVYLESRNAKTREFVASCFSIRGAFALQKDPAARPSQTPTEHAVGLAGLYAAPVGTRAEKVGLVNVGGRLDDVPDGFDTALHQELRWLIYTELLELPLPNASACRTPTG